MQPLAQSPSKLSITQWMVEWIAREMGLLIEEVDTVKSLLNYSLSSVTAMMLVGDLEEWLGLVLPPTLVWDYPSIGAIADYLSEQIDTKAACAVDGNKAVASDEPLVPAATEPNLALDEMSDQEVTTLLNQLIAAEAARAST